MTYGLEIVRDYNTQRVKQRLYYFIQSSVSKIVGSKCQAKVKFITRKISLQTIKLTYQSSTTHCTAIHLGLLLPTHPSLG